MNGTFPERIVFFRDGIGAQQMKAVSAIELSGIYDALKEIGAEQTELLFIVVNKLTSLEVYASGIYEDDSFKNAVSGTVIDHESGITGARNEFYLVSQNMKQGISLPVKYTIVHDTVGGELSEVQLLCHKLCYLYFNVGGPLRFPAPVQYAHKLANLVAEKNPLELEEGPEQDPIRIHESFSQTNSTLFFI